MKKNDFIYFANQYYKFRRQLENNIKNLQHIVKDVCYLIDEFWIQNLDSYFDKLNKGEYSHQNLIPFPKDNPKFINHFLTAVSYIKINKNFKIISQQLIDLLYERNDITKLNVIYYAGNNRLIIEIMENDKNNAFFFINPSNSFRYNSNIFIILKNNISNIYQELISLDNVEYEINKNPKYNNYVIPFVKFINKNFNNIIPFQPNNNNNLNQSPHNREQLNKNVKSKVKNNVKVKQKTKEINISLSPKDNYNMSNNYSFSSESNGPQDGPKNKNKSPIQSDLKNYNNNKNPFVQIKHLYVKKTSKSPNSRNKNISLESRNPNLFHNRNETSGQNNSSTFYNSNDKISNNQDSIINEEYKLKQDKFMNYVRSLENKINTLESESNNKDNIIKILQNNDKKNELAKNEQFQKLLGLKENEIMHYKNQLDILNKEIQLQRNENNSLNGSFHNMKNNLEHLKTENENLRSSLKSLNSENDKLKEENSNMKSNLNQQISMHNHYKINVENYIINLKSKIKDNESFINKNKNKFNINEEEINRKIKEVNKKEKEVNNKIAFLEDKENLIEEENKKLEINKKLNNDLIIKNRQLEKEINNKQNIYNNLISNISNIQPKNNKIKINSIELVMPISLYKEPTLVGLNNIGATCFMNSTLQCLSQTEILTNFFLKEKNKNIILQNNWKNEKYQLAPIYLDLIKKLWAKSGPKSFSPYNFMNTINNMNPLFKTGQAGDSKDFIIFVLEQLHKELKKAVKAPNFNNSIVQPLNQYDKNNAFNNFFDSFQKECSIISDTFFGFTETTNECLYCKNIYNSQGYNNPICYNYGIFNCLIFPLEEVKNMKNFQMNNNFFFQNNFLNNRVSLQDCFIYNQKGEYFTGENRNYCNKCKQLYDSIYTSKIFVSPTVLVLILNRGKGNIYNVKLDFPEILDITQFVLRKDVDKIIYCLYGVITHIGQSGPNAHFVASCKSPVDHQWYRYNDAIVNPITNIQKEIFNFGTPYILFYQKNK